MPEMSGKLKSNPTKTNKLIFIMMGGIYFSRGVGGGKLQISPPPLKFLYTPLQLFMNLEAPTPTIFECKNHYPDCL